MSNSVFPSGIDAFIDPGPNTPQNAAQPHHLMHSVANDAIVAMETTLLQQFMAYAPVIIPDVSMGNVIVIGTLTGDIFISAPINPASYSIPLVFVFTQDSTGGHVVTWHPSFVTTWGIDNTPNNSSSIGFVYQSSSSKWVPVHAFPDQVSITSVSGNLNINGNLDVNGQGFFTSTLNTAGITDTGGITTTGLTTNTLTVNSGPTNFTGNLNVAGNIKATGANGKITANTGIVVSSGGANISGNTSITGSITTTGNITTGGSIIASGTLSLAGAATLSSSLSASGAITAGSFALSNNDFTVNSVGAITGASLVTTGGISATTIAASTSLSTSGPVTASGTISSSSLISSPNGFIGKSGHYVPVVPTGGNGYMVQFGTSVITTDANGFGTIFYPTTFPTGVATVVVCNGDWQSSTGVEFTVVLGNSSTTHIGIHANINSPAPGVSWANTLVRVNWIAWGS